jgi:small subunit ribosomal protein S9
MADDERPEDQPAEGEPTAEEAAPPPTPDQDAPPPEAQEEQPAQAEEEQPAEAEEEQPAQAEEEQPAEAEEEQPAEAEEEQPAQADEAAPAAEAEEQPAAAAQPAAEEKPPPTAEPPSSEPRAKPEIPGADLEVDIVPEGSDPLAAAAAEAAEAELEAAAETAPEPEPGQPEPEAVPQAAIDLAAGARYTATGKRKTAIARVILKPGSGAYAVNGRTLEEYFPRPTSQHNIREPLATVGYEARMDVVASLQGGGVGAQAGALRHGIARALIEADPNLRVELKRRGFLTRDARVKERRKAGLKKARKRPQFSKR